MDSNGWNGSHRLPEYFEWWYFHFATSDGATINLVLHETDILGIKHSPVPFDGETLHAPVDQPVSGVRAIHRFGR